MDGTVATTFPNVHTFVVVVVVVVLVMVFVVSVVIVVAVVVVLVVTVVVVCVEVVEVVVQSFPGHTLAATFGAILPRSKNETTSARSGVEVIACTSVMLTPSPMPRAYTSTPLNFS